MGCMLCEGNNNNDSNNNSNVIATVVILIYSTTPLFCRGQVSVLNFETEVQKKIWKL